MDVTEKAKEVIISTIEAQKEIHINLKNVQYMDSSGISVLIESHQKAMELGTKVILKEISKSVLKSNYDGKIGANIKSRLMECHLNKNFKSM